MTTNLVSVVVKYIPASNHRGSRVKLTVPLSRGKAARFIPYSHEFNSSEDVAAAYLKAWGLTPEARTCLQDGTSALLFSFKDVALLDALLSK